MAVSIHLTDIEYQLADSYAKRHSLTMEEAFTQALFEQIEEETTVLFGKKHIRTT